VGVERDGVLGLEQQAGDLQRAEFEGTPRELFEKFFEGVREEG